MQLGNVYSRKNINNENVYSYNKSNQLIIATHSKGNEKPAKKNEVVYGYFNA